MDVAPVALAVSSLGVLAGLVTLSLVIRNELRERRRMPPVVWGFHRFATATVAGVSCIAAELLQYGRMPTRLISYSAVGFDLHLTAEARVKRFVKAEDTMPLFLTGLDADNAWLFLVHQPRDDRRWTYFEIAPLEPTSDAFDKRIDASLARVLKHDATWAGRLQRLRWRLPGANVVRPVGPDGYYWARLRTDLRGWSDKDHALITSIVEQAGVKAYSPY